MFPMKHPVPISFYKSLTYQIELSSKTVNRLRNNTSVDARRSDLGGRRRGGRISTIGGAGLGGRRHRARWTAARRSELGLRRRGAQTSAARGSDLGGAVLRPRRRGAPTSAAQGSDLGGAGLIPRRTAFLGDSVQPTVARGSANGGAGLGPWLCGVQGVGVRLCEERRWLFD
ncbi:hypothetical protein GUJ93_ZPchr0009g2344 [Zizania palustris]|uniref:Uncharacterized protein n=1 Tax=Zizania palustris TaxID=103762 RepID=A0A8J5RQ92_ZIZPA|nr:hypothetical protein GUJ93_ZPchr0009g2344 [Zizania palustris]